MLQKLRWRAGETLHRRGIDAHLADRTGKKSDRTGREQEADSSRLPSPRYGHDRGWKTSASRSVDAPRPFRPRPIPTVENPVLTAADVTDYGDVDFVADPFLFPAEDGGWHLFFEAYNRDRTPTGVIGHATSTNGRAWRYRGVVLQTNVHLAFPYIFEWKGTYYMIPDRWDRESPAPILIYRTASLPNEWERVSTVVEPDRQLADCVVFRWDRRWWALLGSDDGRHDLYAYYSNELLADHWTAHAENPVASDRPRAARPAGRPIVGDDSILVFLQDCDDQYGDKVRAFDVTELTPTAYIDQERPESPILEATGGLVGWNSGRMHHVDPWYTNDGWRCAVDGNVFGRRLFGPNHWAIGLYRA